MFLGPHAGSVIQLGMLGKITCDLVICRTGKSACAECNNNVSARWINRRRNIQSRVIGIKCSQVRLVVHAIDDHVHATRCFAGPSTTLQRREVFVKQTETRLCIYVSNRSTPTDFPDSVASPPPSMNRFVLPRFGNHTKPRLSNCALRSCASGPCMRGRRE